MSKRVLIIEDTDDTGQAMKQLVASVGYQVAYANDGVSGVDLAATFQPRRDFNKHLAVEDLANQVGMSVSSFHSHFRSVAGTSPLQFQKALRLIEARRLLVGTEHDSTSAAYAVGYESPSQFSREYSRMFGNPPARDVSALRTARSS